MDKFSLYERMREHGTLAEAPREVPDARFALPSTINWMRALAILVDPGLDFQAARHFYKKVHRRALTDRELNSVGEQMLFTLHQIAALQAIAKAENGADVARVGIVAWYYGVYGAASAMIAAADGSFPVTHAATAQQWLRQFPANNLALEPFDGRLSNLLDETVQRELAPVRLRGSHSLTIKPTTMEQAWGCHVEYLSGTADWEQWNVRERVKESRDFKALGVSDFRTKSARALRDEAYAKRGIGFLHEASRYRGKANYRDAIYLAYGKSVQKLLNVFPADLAVVLISFSTMATAYIEARMGRQLWAALLADLDEKRAVSVSPLALWS